jgi:hypothetical protein
MLCLLIFWIFFSQTENILIKSCPVVCLFICLYFKYIYGVLKLRVQNYDEQ